MVLDIYDPNQDLLVFKNTFDDEDGGQPKRFILPRTDPNAPEELFFVHIKVRDMENLPSQEQRQADKITEEQEKRKQLQKK